MFVSAELILFSPIELGQLSRMMLFSFHADLLLLRVSLAQFKLKLQAGAELGNIVS